MRLAYVMNPIRKEVYHDLAAIRRNTKGWHKDPPIRMHPKILVGAGSFLTPEFAKEHEITHVINCAFPQDCPSWWDRDPKVYTVLNAEDNAQCRILQWYPAFEAILTEYLRDPECKTVQVHCQCGMNRSAQLTLAQVVDHFGLNWEDTVRAMVEQRPCCLTNTAQWYQVKSFAKSRASKHGVPQ